MNKRKISLFLAILFTLSVLLCSCSGSGGVMNGGGGFGGGYGGDYDYTMGEGSSPGGSVPEKAPSKEPESADGTVDGDESDDTAAPEQTTRPAGLMTAGAWSDNDNYEFFKTLFDQGDGENERGKFNVYTGDNSWGFTSLKRIKVTVKNGDTFVAGAGVRAESADGTLLFEAVTDAAGVAYLFTHENTGIVHVSSDTYTAGVDFTADTRELEISLDGSAEKKNVIDVMFVVDVTGSMGDELSFLQNEIDDVINRVAEKHSDAVVNLALLFYRDKVDTEEFAYYDFKDVTDPVKLAEQKAVLNKQAATGGGDTPESVDEALEIAINKQWSSAATTKLIFHVLDAPPHSDTAGQERYVSAVEAAAKKGIRICPILCSGADTLTEYLTRQAAIYTGGTFIFVTDDSGIGNSHHDPSLPNVTVEALNSMLVRLISGYHSGSFDTPVDWRQEVK